MAQPCDGWGREAGWMVSTLAKLFTCNSLARHTATPYIETSMSDSMPDIRTINLNCSLLRDGGRYRIRTEAMVGMNITLCDQEWISEEQDNSLPVGYYSKGDTDISPPVLRLTAQEIWMKKCVNLTLMLQCDQAGLFPGFRILVSSDAGEEETTSHGFIETTTHGFTAAVVGGSIGALAVILLVLAVGCWHRVRRPCGNEAVVEPQSDQLQGGTEAGDGFL
ncbi:uncharacterized protein LOC125732190 isoform X2 [Brienomyrus brachyistius]|uniref:uncharacterized protein LOC125732190 isoform X2 n=1 Tax=Brienomyrus brachyistius TaxID=42636 RepID=UPI0020B2782A|nr:uncharacterized protein LOC125732190 isoform X2 [Brienomyrus brachyistius]